MSIKRKPTQIIVDMNAHMWWVFIEELWWLLQVAARDLYTRMEQHNVSPVNLREHQVSVFRETRNSTSSLQRSSRRDLTVHLNRPYINY